MTLRRRTTPKTASRSATPYRTLTVAVVLLLVASITGSAAARSTSVAKQPAAEAAPATRSLLARDHDAPKAPTLLSVNSASASSITLTWAASSDNVGVAGYGIYRNGMKVGTTTTRSFAFSGLSCGKTYRLGVDAFDAARNRSTVSFVDAATKACSDSTAPSAPPYLRQSGPTQTGLTLEWGLSTDQVGVAGYTVYRDGVPVTTTQQRSFWLSGLVCGASYSVAVEAFDAAGNRSARTAAVVSTNQCGDTTPPTPARWLAVDSTTETSVSISWHAGSDDRGVAGYRTYVNDVQTGTTTTLATTFGGLACGRSYTFKVVAFDAAGNVSPAETLVAETAQCGAIGSDSQPPTVPGGLTGSGMSGSSISLSWNASSDNVGISSYGVYRNGTKIADSGAAPYVVQGLSCATSYNLAVDAVDASGNRSAKATVTAATNACQVSQPPTAPTGLGQLSRTETSITLSWQPASDDVGVTGYRVFRDGTQVGTTASTSYAVTGLTCATGYTLGVEAYDADGNRSTRPATMLSTAACSDTAAPSSPSSVQKTGATASTIALGWTAASDNVGVAGYTLYVGGSVVGTTAQTSYSFSGLTCGTTYTIGIEAYDAAGNRSQRVSLSAATATCAAPPPPASGSIYVALNGSDANPCTQAQPCLTFGRAYKAAAPGATVLVAAGTYPAQEIDEDPNKLTGASVVFEPAGGAVNVNGTIHFGQDQFGRRGPKGVTIRNMSITYLRAWAGSERLLWENIDSVHFDMDAKDSVVRGGDYGPCQAPRDDPSCLSRIFGTSSNVLVENAAFHNVTSTDLANYHVDGMAIFGGENVTIRSNRFYANMITNIRVQNCCGNPPIKNLVIENNWFAAPLQGDNVSTNANGIDIDSAIPGLKLRFNSFAEGGYPQIATTQPDAQMTGNLLTHVSCAPGVTYSYNVFKPWSEFQGQNACSSTDKKVSSLGYAGGGYSLASSSPAIDHVPPSVGCPAKDVAGGARPLGAGCDAGASELR